jgi:hypothetical protein
VITLVLLALAAGALLGVLLGNFLRRRAELKP